MAAKSPQEMAEDIIKSLKITDSASILLDLYLERAIQEHKKEAVQEYIEQQKSNPEPPEYKPGY